MEAGARCRILCVGADGHIEAHVWQGHEHDRLLPTSMRETRFSLAYSHPYDRNLMPGRQA